MATTKKPCPRCRQRWTKELLCEFCAAGKTNLISFDEVARVQRLKMERTLAQPRAADPVQPSLSEDFRPIDAAGQVSLF